MLVHHLCDNHHIAWTLNDEVIVVVEGIGISQASGRDTTLVHGNDPPECRRLGRPQEHPLEAWNRIPPLPTFRGVTDSPIRRVDDK